MSVRLPSAECYGALQRIDPGGGPPPGPHNFFRGAPPSVYDGETRGALAALRGQVDTDAATAVWEAALASTWQDPPVWFHGDVSAGNLLVVEDRLSAVLDFGISGVGDPACDLTIAWTLLSGEGREAFRAGLPLDGATWARGRGWALWKALITRTQHSSAPQLTGRPLARAARLRAAPRHSPRPCNDSPRVSAGRCGRGR